jgi:hypothetical protein
MRDEQRNSEDLEHFAGGEIQARHGIVNKWLLVVYTVLFVWSIYYLTGPFEGWRPTFGFWGGLGPGLARGSAQQVLGDTGVIAFWVTLISVVGFFVWVVALTLKK